MNVSSDTPGRRRSPVLAFFLLLAASASAQLVEENVNVTGSPAPGYDTGQRGRQENEPSCGINPLNELNILCAYNWYGYADLPDKQGDAWIAFSESIDGRNFMQRPLTGTKQNYPLGKEFAADPTLLVWPGGAAVTSIVGDRNGNSVMVIQRMMELNRETGFRHVSEAGQVQIASIQGSNFIDKPDAHVLIRPGGGTRSVTMMLEEKDGNGDNLVVTREWPQFRIVVTFAVFNGSDQNIRTFSTWSDDFGASGSWSNPRQITQTSGLDQGLSITSMGDTILYTVRRFDSGAGDSIMGAISRDAGNRIGKVFQITGVCEFDQQTAPNLDQPFKASSRSNMFPWVSATGSHFMLTYVERPRDALGNCLADYSGVAGTRVMVRTSANGTNWSDAVPVTPFQGEPVHFQFMPNVNCARGACNVIFYSTLSESLAFEDLLGTQIGTRHWEQNPFIEDFNVDDPLLGLLRYRRTVDIFSSKIRIGGGGAPLVSATPERVSRYQIDYDEAGNAFERESNPLNVRIYGGNTVPFSGDYIALGVQSWRVNPSTGQWEANASPLGAIDDPANRVSYFAAWTDHRRIRGHLYDDTFFDGLSQAPLPYEVVDNTGTARNEDADEGSPGARKGGGKTPETTPRVTDPGAPLPRQPVMLAARPDRFLSAYARRAEGPQDANPGAMSCSPAAPPTHPTGEYQTRIKNSEIYGATIEDRVRLVSPTVAKTLGTIQRGFVIGSENVDPVNPRTLRLVIANQPGQTAVAPGTDPVPVVLPTARASWRQLPFGPSFDPLSDPLPVLEEVVTIQPLSTEFVTLFVVTQAFNEAPVTIHAYDGAAFVSQLSVNGDSEAGELLDPGTTPGFPVTVFEIHDPDLIEPVWADLEVNALNPNYKNPNLKNPNFKNPNFKNTDYMDPNLKNPNLKNPNFKNTTEEATSLQNPNLKNPNLKNTTAPDSFIDATYTVVSANNTTTAVNVDFAYGAGDLDDLDVEVIAWKADELDTLQDCEAGLITESKVVSARSNPNLKNLAPADIHDPFQGFVTFPLAPNGQVQVTVRIFCEQSECEDLIALDTNGESRLSQFLGYNFWAQKANTGQTELAPNREQIIKDVIPPAFSVENGHTFVAEATGPGGAIVNLADGTGVGEIIGADDDGSPAAVSCVLAPPGETPQPMAALAPLGESGAQCEAADGAGNLAVWSGFVRVEDNAPPVISVPGGNGAVLVAVPASAAGVTVDFLAPGGFNGATITVAEAVSPDAVTFSCSPQNGSLFPIGATAVTCSASDAGPCDPAGASCANGVNVSAPVSFTVSVIDADPPVINGGTALDDLVVEATAVLTPVALTPPTVSDIIDPAPVIVNDAPAAGFALGSTPITWTATDFSGNQTIAMQNVIVQDTTPPQIQVPADIDVTSNLQSGTAVDFAVTAADVFPTTIDCIVQGAGTLVESGDLFPVGTTTVQCTATDSSGNSASASFAVTVTFVYVTTGISSNKASAKTGSSVPLSWAWLDGNGVPQDIGDNNQSLKVTAGSCPGGSIVAEDPGSSGFREKSDLSWEYNWQAVDANGDKLPASGRGTPYCITVTLTTNGQQQNGQILLKP